ncbi:MAG: thiamine pyrophosphate-binding protein, partial [archaeon]|nr:thiamine pyrophosphate-binding protein [archaeon]
MFGVFGNPGTTEMPMLQSVDRYFLTLHDSIAVSMADGYSLYELIPSTVNLHAMPGVGNSMAFIHTAALNRSPVVITSGQQDTRHEVHAPLLYGDLVSLVSHSVKSAYEI